MFEEIRKLIERYDTIVLHRHLKPDGDALGSQIGLKHLILDNYPGKQVYMVGDEAGRYAFMADCAMDTVTDAQYAGALAILPEYVVCSNGAAILSRDVTQQTGYARHTVETFDPSEVLTLLHQNLPDGNYLVELADGSRLFTHFVDDWGLQRDNARQVELEEMKRQQVARVVVVSPEHNGGGQTNRDFIRLVEQIGLHGVSYAVGWSAWLDIAPKGVDKSTALERVREWQGIAPQDVVVIGDGRNDIGMFEWAKAHGGRAFVMADSPEEVVAASTDPTGSVADGGVAQAIGVVLGAA